MTDEEKKFLAEEIKKALLGQEIVVQDDGNWVKIKMAVDQELTLLRSLFKSASIIFNDVVGGYIRFSPEQVQDLLQHYGYEKSEASKSVSAFEQNKGSWSASSPQKIKALDKKKAPNKPKETSIETGFLQGVPFGNKEVTQSKKEDQKTTINKHKLDDDNDFSKDGSDTAFLEDNNNNKKVKPSKAEIYTDVIMSDEHNKDPAISKLDFTRKQIDLSGLSLNLDDLQKLWEKIQGSEHIGHIVWPKVLPSGSEQLKKQIEDKIIKNNTDFQRHPSDFVHGLLSSHVYENSTPNTDVQFKDAEKGKKYGEHLKGWKVHDVISDGNRGYYGVIYEHEDNKQIVLVHRGTTTEVMDIFKPNTAWQANLAGIVVGKIVPQQKMAFEAAAKAVEYAKQKDYYLSITGHSLGGWLAENSLYFTVYDFNYPSLKVRAVTFDSPGSSKTFESFKSSINNPSTKTETTNLNITTYLSKPNFVNTCNGHTGKVYEVPTKIADLPNSMTSVLDKLKNTPLIGTKIKENEYLLHGMISIVGHSMDLILDNFSPQTGKPFSCKEMQNWPVTQYTPTSSTLDNIQKLINDGLNKTIPIPDVSKVLSWSVSKALIGKVEATTLGSLIQIVGDFFNGEVGQQQYWKFFELANQNEQSGSPISSGDNFGWTYEACYEPKKNLDLNQDVLSSSNKTSADWYLSKLRMLSNEEIRSKFGEDSIIIEQLSKLKETFKVEHHEGKKHLISKNITVEQLREQMIRLMEVNLNVKKSLENLEKKTNVVSEETGHLSSDGLSTKINNFVGRESELKKLDNILNDSDNNNSNSSHKVAIITGMPGIGKSSLAAKYGASKSNSEAVVLWVDSDSLDKIQSYYYSLAERLGVANTGEKTSDKIIKLVKDKLEIKKGSLLVIFDNVENYDHVKEYLNELPRNAKAIVTTRHADLSDSDVVDKSSNKVAINRGLTNAEAAEFVLKSKIKNKISIEKGTQEQELKTLIDCLNPNGKSEVLPYDLNMAVRLIAGDKLGSIGKYLEDISKLPKDEGKTAILKKLLEKSEFAWPILQYAVHLDTDFISISVLKEIFFVDDDELKAPINALESLSAVEIVWHDRTKESGIRLHKLTQEQILNYLKVHPEDGLPSEAIMEELLRALQELLPFVTYNPDESWQQARMVVPHVKKILSQSVTVNRDNNNNYTDHTVIDLLANLYGKLGVYYQHVMSSYNESIYCSEQALALKRVLYGNELSHAIADSLNNMGLAYLELPNKDGVKIGLKKLQESLEIRKKLLNDQAHPLLAQTLNNIVIAYEKLNNKEDIPKCIELIEKALEIYKQFYGDEPDQDFALTLNRAGYNYLRLGNTDRGLELLEGSLTMSRNLDGDQPHSGTARALNGIGGALHNLGGEQNAKEGLKLIKEALQIYNKFYGDDRPNSEFANTLINCGIAEKTLGNASKAIALIERGRIMYEKLDNTYEVIRAQDFLRKFGGEGEFKTHIQKLEAELEIRKKMYGSQAHEDLTKSLEEIGWAYKSLGGKENILKSIELFEEANRTKEWLYGREDLHMASSLHDLGLMCGELRDKPNLLKSLGLLKEAYEIRQKLYQDNLNHPSLTDSLQCLESCYIELKLIEGISDPSEKDKLFIESLSKEELIARVDKQIVGKLREEGERAVFENRLEDAKSAYIKIFKIYTKSTTIVKLEQLKLAATDLASIYYLANCMMQLEELKTQYGVETNKELINLCWMGKCSIVEKFLQFLQSYDNESQAMNTDTLQITGEDQAFQD